MITQNTLAMFRFRNKIIANQPVRQFFKELFESKSKVTSKKPVGSNSFGHYEIVTPWPITERRTVPDAIPCPPYARTSIPQNSLEEPEIKDENQIECMRHSCILAKGILNSMKPRLKPGITTDQIDHEIHELIINNGAYPSPLNYRGFPKSVCTSVNNVACHGIPDTRPLQEGDILNIDVTVYLNGYHGDCSATYMVGEVDSEAKRLINATETCLMNAISICKPNENFSSIGHLIEEIAQYHGFGIIPAFVGHGIGSYFHGPPDIFHYANSGTGEMQAGMTFTIEPILTQGGEEIRILDDGWTAVTVDNARTAQMEHTILITDHGCDILTY